MNYELVFGSISLRFVPIWWNGWKQRSHKEQERLKKCANRKICIKILLFMCVCVCVCCSVVSTWKSIYNEGKNSDAHSVFVHIKKQTNWKERSYGRPLLIFKYNVTHFFSLCTVCFLVLITVCLENELWILHAPWPIRMVNENRRGRGKRKRRCVHVHLLIFISTHAHRIKYEKNTHPHTQCATLLWLIRWAESKWEEKHIVVE